MPDWGIVAIIAVVVIFGASKLPQIARNMGKAQGEFKKGLKEGATGEDTPAPAAPQAVPPAAPSAEPQATTPPADQPHSAENPPSP